MLTIEGLSVDRGGVRAVDDVHLRVSRGEVVAVLGPSGAGKSSLLLAAAGLVDVAAGRVGVDGHDVTGVPPHRRGVGMVFQEYALFPHLSVAGNIAYGLHGDGRGTATHREVVEDWLDRLGLPPTRFADRDVATLSGGQRQRVALARALAPAPPVLLLDEPFGALDRQLREELAGGLEELLHAEDAPAVVAVTHDRDEAMTVGDRVAVMRDGRIAALDRPPALWLTPPDAWTARFLGHPNVLSPSDAGALGLPAIPVVLPPTALRLVAYGTSGARGGVVVAVVWRDGRQRVRLGVDGVVLTIDLPSGGPTDLPGGPGAPIVVGDRYAVEVDAGALRGLPG